MQWALHPMYDLGEIEDLIISASSLEEKVFRYRSIWHSIAITPLDSSFMERQRYITLLYVTDVFHESINISDRLFAKLASGISDLDNGIVVKMLEPAKYSGFRFSTSILACRAGVAMGAHVLIKAGQSRSAIQKQLHKKWRIFGVLWPGKQLGPAALECRDEFSRTRFRHEVAKGVWMNLHAEDERLAAGGDPPLKRAEERFRRIQDVLNGLIARGLINAAA
jgi:hypothetical protein